MPQNPLAATVAVKNGAQNPMNLDANGNLKVAVVSNTPSVTGSVQYNITAATAVKAAAGTVLTVNVVVAGSAAGAVHDVATTGAVAAANQIAALPASIGTYTLNWPCAAGIVLVPGTGQTLSVSFE